MTDSSQHLPYLGLYAITVDMSRRGFNHQACVGSLDIAGPGPNLFVHTIESFNQRHRFRVNAAPDKSQGDGMLLVQDEGRPLTFRIGKTEGKSGAIWTFEQVYRGSRPYQIFMNPKLEAALNWVLSELM